VDGRTDVQLQLSNRVSFHHFAVAWLLSTIVNETCATKTYIRYWLDLSFPGKAEVGYLIVHSEQIGLNFKPKICTKSEAILQQESGALKPARIYRQASTFVIDSVKNVDLKTLQ